MAQALAQLRQRPRSISDKVMALKSNVDQIVSSRRYLPPVRKQLGTPSTLLQLARVSHLHRASQAASQTGERFVSIAGCSASLLEELLLALRHQIWLERDIAVFQPGPSLLLVHFEFLVRSLQPRVGSLRFVAPRLFKLVFDAWFRMLCDERLVVWQVAKLIITDLGHLGREHVEMSGGIIELGIAPGHLFLRDERLRYSMHIIVLMAERHVLLPLAALLLRDLLSRLSAPQTLVVVDLLVDFF